jgi:hypothetical protein
MLMATYKIVFIAVLAVTMFLCFTIVLQPYPGHAITAGVNANPGDILINEIYYDSPQTGTDSAWEWLELYNPTNATVDLSGWTIEDNAVSDSVPPLSLPPGSFAIIAAAANFSDNFPGCSCTIMFIADGRIGSGLSNDGDRIQLKDSVGATIDAISYGTDTTYTSLPDVAAGHSLERSPAGSSFLDNPDPSPCSAYSSVTATPTPSPTSTSIASPTPTSTAEAHPGDVNNDGVLNCIDITQCELCILDPVKYPKGNYTAWDADGNGEGPNSADILAIVLRILEKWPP